MNSIMSNILTTGIGIGCTAVLIASLYFYFILIIFLFIYFVLATVHRKQKGFLNTQQELSSFTVVCILRLNYKNKGQNY